LSKPYPAPLLAPIPADKKFVKKQQQKNEKFISTWKKLFFKRSYFIFYLPHLYSWSFIADRPTNIHGPVYIYIFAHILLQSKTHIGKGEVVLVL